MPRARASPRACVRRRSSSARATLTRTTGRRSCSWAHGETGLRRASGSAPRAERTLLAAAPERAAVRDAAELRAHRRLEQDARAPETARRRDAVGRAGGARPCVGPLALPALGLDETVDAASAEAAARPRHAARLRAIGLAPAALRPG